MTLPFVAPNAPILVHGITGRTGRSHSRHMRAYGTNIVAGVSAHEDEVDGVPVFRTTAAARQASGASAAVSVVPPFAVLDVIRECADAGLELVVTLAEGVPVHDAVKARQISRAAGLRWVGASTPGLAIPGRTKLGFLPSASLAPGSFGIMAKSGTLSYEVCYRMVRAGLGQSLWVGVGGDTVKGTRFADLVPYFEEDPATRAVVMIGEIGGDEEEELAITLIERNVKKPVLALIAGSAAREGVTMGHAGALIHGDVGTVASKTTALNKAGARVFTRINDLVNAATTISTA